MGSPILLSIGIELIDRDYNLIHKIEDEIESILFNFNFVEEEKSLLQGVWDDKSLYFNRKADTTDSIAGKTKLDIKECLMKYKNKIDSSTIRILDLEFDGEEKDLLEG